MSATREWSAREATLKVAEVQLANLARSLIQHAEDSFDLLDTSILGAVSRLETDGPSPAIISKLQDVLVARKAASKRVSALAIVDEHGDWLASSGAMGKNLSDREYFRHHLQSTDRDAFIGHPVKSSVNGEWVVTVSRRFNHPDGSFAGIVIASIGSAYFSDYYGQFDVGESGALSLLSSDGVILARRPDDDTSAGRDVSEGAFYKAMRSGGFSGAHYLQSDLDRRRRLGFHQQSNRYPFIVLATKAQDEVLAPWRHATITRMMFVLGLVVLIAVMGFYLVRQLLRGQRMAARYGGEEFAMLLPNTDAAGCARIGERILREIRDAGIAHKLNFPSRIVTASIGGAVCRPGVERSAGHASLVEAADLALYAAKDHGRDRLIMAKPAVRKLEVMSAAN